MAKTKAKTKGKKNAKGDHRVANKYKSQVEQLCELGPISLQSIGRLLTGYTAKELEKREAVFKAFEKSTRKRHLELEKRLANASRLSSAFHLIDTHSINCVFVQNS